MAANCSVCFHVRRKQIDAFMKENANYGPILRWLRDQKKNDETVRTYSDKRALRKHRVECLGLEPLASHFGGKQEPQTLVQVEDLPNDVSAEELGKRARRRLAGKLDDLSAKDLHTIVVESMKLEREKVRRAKDAGYDDSDEAGDDVKSAMADFEEAAARKSETSEKNGD